MANWERQPQEKEGTYEFSGFLLVTRGVQEILSEAEMMNIVLDVKQAVLTTGGLDYLQVYKNDEGQKIWLIDQLSREMLASDDYTPDQKKEYNHFTMLLPEEY